MPSARDKSPMMAVDRKPDIECLVKSENGGFGGYKQKRMAETPAVNPAPPPQLPSVQMFDTEVLYRRWYFLCEKKSLRYYQKFASVHLK